jgi:large subunit ribosomal protein L30
VLEIPAAAAELQQQTGSPRFSSKKSTGLANCPTSATAFMSVETFKIVQTGSPIRRHHKQRETLFGLGLNRIGRVAEVPNTRATWGMIAKVRHLVRVIDENLFEEHRLPDRHVADQDADKRLLRNLIFEPRRISAETIPEDQNKTPDFKLLKDGALRAYCEMKSPTDGDLFDFPDDLASERNSRGGPQGPGHFQLGASHREGCQAI